VPTRKLAMQEIVLRVSSGDCGVDCGELATEGFFSRLTEHAPTTGLPAVTRPDFTGSQPTVPVAGCVQIERESQVQDLVVTILGVADDHALARNVGSKLLGIKESPAEEMTGMIGQGQIGIVAGVREQKLVCLNVGEQVLQKGPVRGRNVAEVSAKPVGIECADATTILPGAESGLAVACLQKHFLMVATNHPDLTLVVKPDKTIDDSSRITPVVYQITEEDESILRGGRDDFEERFQSEETAMDIPEGDQAGWSSGHGGRQAVEGTCFRLLPTAESSVGKCDIPVAVHFKRGPTWPAGHGGDSHGELTVTPQGGCYQGDSWTDRGTADLLRIGETMTTGVGPIHKSPAGRSAANWFTLDPRTDRSGTRFRDRRVALT